MISYGDQNFNPIYSIKRDNLIVNTNLNDMVILFDQPYNQKLSNSIIKEKYLYEPLILIKMDKKTYSKYISFDVQNQINAECRLSLDYFKDNKKYNFIKIGNQRYKILKKLKYTHCDCIIFNSYKEYINSKYHKPTKGDIFYTTSIK